MDKNTKDQKWDWKEKSKEYGGLVPFYPSTRYIEENLAPEELTTMQIQALAHANQDARKNKLMSPNMLDKIDRKSTRLNSSHT